MCKLKSAIILKDRIFMPDYDSHSKMLDELGISDDYLGASKKFVRVELSPKNGDVFTDIDSWIFNVDQDIRPEWFSVDEYKPKMIEAVKEWAKTHIHIGVVSLKITAGENHYIKDCKGVEIYDSAQVKNICGSAQVENIYDSAQVENIYDSAQVKYIYGSAQVENIYGSAQVENIYGSAQVKYIYGSAQVKNIYDSAQVEKVSDIAVICSDPNWAWKNASSVILCENATFKDNRAKVIYQSGDYKLVTVESGKKISESEDK